MGSSTTAERRRLAIPAPHVSPSAVSTASASAIFALSRLNNPPHTIAVYASPRTSPPATQHSLPSRRYPLLGRDFHPLDHSSFPDALTFAYFPVVGDHPGGDRLFRSLHVPHRPGSRRQARQSLNAPGWRCRRAEGGQKKGECARVIVIPFPSWHIQFRLLHPRRGNRAPSIFSPRCRYGRLRLLSLWAKFPSGNPGASAA